jgi:predicted TIM-barrel fold metal-dependent hydrolase
LTLERPDIKAKSGVSDLAIVDAHHHLWYLKVGYPWLSNDSGSLSAIHGDESSLRRDYGPAKFVAESQAYQLSGSVAIEAAAEDPLMEGRWLQRCAEKSGVPSAFVAGGRLEEPNWPSVLEAYSGMDGIRGVRQILCWHPDPRFSYIADRDLMERRSWREGFGRLADYGLSFDLQIYPWQFEAATALAVEHPSTIIILNHAGMCLDRTREGYAVWRHAMLELAKRPNICVKVSGLAMLDHHWTPDRIREIILRTIDWFGVERVMFGSNFPVDGLHGRFDEIYDAFMLITDSFTREDRECMFAGNARRVYRI